VYGRPQLVANQANRLVALLPILFSDCWYNQHILIVEYFYTNGERDTMPGNVGGIFLRVELNFPFVTLCDLHTFVN